MDIEPLDIENSENLEYLQYFEFYDKQQLENDLVSARDPEKTPLKASTPCDEYSVDTPLPHTSPMTVP